MLPALGGRALEPTAHKLRDTPFRRCQQQACSICQQNVRPQPLLHFSFAQDGAQLGFNSVEKLGHAQVQAFGFPEQRIAMKNPGNARVALAEPQQQQQNFIAGVHRALSIFVNARNSGEQRFFHKFNQRFEHFCF